MGSGRTWTEEDIIYLQENWGVLSKKAIANHLERTVEAINLKAGKLRLGDSRCTGENIIFNSFCIAIGISNYTIKTVWVRNGFKLIKRSYGSRKCYYINVESFWKWAEEHKELVNFSRMEENILGKEPEWVKEKRKADKMDPTKINHNRMWSKEEENLLVAKVNSYRYTYEDLSKEFNRSQAAIKRKLYELQVSARPVPKDNTIKWTDEEHMKLKECVTKGYGAVAIAKVIGKSEFSIREKIKAIV